MTHYYMFSLRDHGYFRPLRSFDAAWGPLGSIKTPEGSEIPMSPRAGHVIITFLYRQLERKWNKKANFKRVKTDILSTNLTHYFTCLNELFNKSTMKPNLGWRKWLKVCKNELRPFSARPGRNDRTKIHFWPSQAKNNSNGIHFRHRLAKKWIFSAWPGQKWQYWNPFPPGSSV